MTDRGIGIQHAAVIGAGTMGAGIAALLARAGVQVDLLDMVPDRLTQPEIDQGLAISSSKVRNRISAEGWARAVSSRPVNQIPVEAAARVSIGNMDDDLGRLGQADWIIEAAFEDLSVKRQLMAAIETAMRPEAVVSTNTSGIPLREIVEGRSRAFSQHFLGAHFFNPPLRMKLVEVIPGPDTDLAVLRSMTDYLEGRLEKGVVVCKDTPNFIANRVTSMQSSFDMNYVLTHGYTVEEADAILGPAVGRPSTALFRLRDLVGLDVSARVTENLYRAIPHDPYRELLMSPRLRALRTTMVERGMIGRKSGRGFYRARTTDETGQFLPLDLETLEYVESQPFDFPTLSQAMKIDDTAERLRFLVSKDDPVGRLVWASLSHVMSYAAYCIPEIADGPHLIDRALRWGYSWQLGPFEIWDALGVSAILNRMKDEGARVAEWVDWMLNDGHDGFYKSIDGRAHAYSPTARAFVPLDSLP